MIYTVWDYRPLKIPGKLILKLYTAPKGRQTDITFTVYKINTANRTKLKPHWQI